MAITDKDINPVVDYDALIQDCRVNTNKVVEKPPVILSIKEITTVSKLKRIFTFGNISVIKGKMKAKKTFLLSLFTSAIIKGSDYNNILEGGLPDGKNIVIYFDTEQGDYDSYYCIKRIEKMAGGNDNFHAFNLRRFTPKERIEIIKFIFNKFKDKMGYVVIDGIADLVMAINDEVEAKEVESMLMKYSGKYNFHISVVIHENKGNDFATGHIGSAILKKAEIVISAIKCKSIYDSSDIVCDMSRSQGFEPFVMTINQYGYPYINKDVSKQNNSTYIEEPDKTPPF